MKLIVGLGNPGKKYSETRHNVGFMALDELASDAGGQFPAFGQEAKFNAEISQGEIGGEKTILAKPQTFMNESGIAVKAIADYYKIPAESIIVIHDDLDIKLGEWKLAKDRGSAGHKGVGSIIEILGTKDFIRIRIGIGKPPETKQIPIENFVLENFGGDEKTEIKSAIKKTAELIRILTAEGFDKAMNSSK